MECEEFGQRRLEESEAGSWRRDEVRLNTTQRTQRKLSEEAERIAVDEFQAVLRLQSLEKEVEDCSYFRKKEKNAWNVKNAEPVTITTSHAKDHLIMTTARLIIEELFKTLGEE